MRIFATILTSLLFIGSLQGQATFFGENSNACGPPGYCAQTNLNFLALPSVPPQMGANACTAGLLNLQNCGNLLGAGSSKVDPNFNSSITRLTDASYWPPIAGNSFVTASSGSGDERLFNCNDTMVQYEEQNGARHLPANFIPGAASQRMYSSAVGWTTTGGFYFNSAPSFWGANCPADTNILYVVNNGQTGSSSGLGTKLGHLDFTNQSVVPSITSDFDFSSSSNCLGSGFSVTWTTNGESDGGDNDFLVGFSNSGGQGGAGAVYVAVWRRGSGCRVLNIGAGAGSLTVKADWGPTGAITGTTCTGTLHNIKAFKIGGTSGAVLIQYASPCGDAHGAPYVWFYAASSLTNALVPICPNSQCGGHWTEGLLTWANQPGNNAPNYADVRTLSNMSPIGIIPTIPSFPGVPMDWHFGWNSLNDTSPFCGASSLWKGDPVTTAWQNEIVCFQPFTSGLQYRMAQCEQTGVSQIFPAQYCIGSVSQTGKYFMFTSDWKCTLGSSHNTAAGILNGPDWVANKVYSGVYTPFVINPNAGNAGNFSFSTTSGGTSSGTAPVWDQTIGHTVTDGSVTWTNIGVPDCRSDVFVVDLTTAH